MKVRMTINTRFLVLFAAVALLVLYPSGHVSASHGEGASCEALPPASAPGFEAKLETFIAGHCSRAPGWMHDANIRSSGGVHPFVKIWYSAEIWRWITVEQRKGNPPDGAMLVKEQFSEPSDSLDSWTIMVKDAKGSHDGWYWADLSPSSPSPSNTSVDSD